MINLHRYKVERIVKIIEEENNLKNSARIVIDFSRIFMYEWGENNGRLFINWNA